MEINQGLNRNDKSWSKDGNGTSYVDLHIFLTKITVLMTLIFKLNAIDELASYWFH